MVAAKLDKAELLEKLSLLMVYKQAQTLEGTYDVKGYYDTEFYKNVTLKGRELSAKVNGKIMFAHRFIDSDTVIVTIHKWSRILKELNKPNYRQFGEL